MREQREAALALRAAGPPALPCGLLDRLRAVPQTTPVPAVPTVVADDGSMMFATFAPVAALAPAPPSTRSSRRNPMVAGAAAVALTGALAAGAVAYGAETSSPVGTYERGTDQVQVSRSLTTPASSTSVLFGTPVSVFRAARP